MKGNQFRKYCSSIRWMILLCVLGSIGYAQTTAFTYQGKLTDAGNPANGNYDLQFKLFDTVTVGTGTQQGATLVRTPVVVSAGIFTVTLDFGANVFSGADRFLEIGVRPAGSANPYTVLAPRQPITSSPYAIQTLNAQQLGGLPASGFVQNTMTAQAGASFNVGGTGTVGSLNINNTASLLGSAAPATAPVGQGRLYFDAATNKLKVSESGGAFVNLVGASGVSGSGTVNTIPLWSAGTMLGNSLITQSAAGNVGIGAATPQAKLDVNGAARFMPGGSGGVVNIGTPGGTETGVNFDNASTRGELRFDGTSLKLVAGPAGAPPPVINGVTVNTLGNVGIGTSNPPIAKLHVLTAIGGLPAIYAESLNRGVWGKSTGSSYGVYGESESGIGMQGVSTSNIGVGGISSSNFAVAGTSTSSIGVRGETASTSITAPGVRGVSTGAGGVGVRGDGTTGVYGVSSNGVGVTGEANASGSTGVYGTSTSGYAMYANGNVGQALNKGGFVKAMVYVAANGNIQRCFNSQRADGGAGSPPFGTIGCGFSVEPDPSTGGNYIINFGFQVDNRFASVTAGRSGNFAAFAHVLYVFPQALQVETFLVGDNSQVPAEFTVIVY